MQTLDSKRHVVVLGPIGAGKTTYLQGLLGITSLEKIRPDYYYNDWLPAYVDKAFSVFKQAGQTRIVISDGIYLPESTHLDHKRQVQEGKPLRHTHWPEDLSNETHLRRHFVQWLTKYDPFYTEESANLIFDGKIQISKREQFLNWTIQEHSAVPFKLKKDGGEELITEGFSRTFCKMEQIRTQPYNWPKAYGPLYQYVLTEMALGDPMFSGVRLAEQLRASLISSSLSTEQPLPTQFLNDVGMVISIKPHPDIVKRQELFLQVDENLKSDSELFNYLYTLGLASPPKEGNLDVFKMTSDYDFNKPGGMRDLFLNVGVPRENILEVENIGTRDELINKALSVREWLIADFRTREEREIRSYLEKSINPGKERKG